MLSFFANPGRFLALSAWALPLSALLALGLLGVGLPWGLFFAPADYLQGESVRIMFVHVPAAWWGMGAYSGLAIAGFVYLVWRHSLADVAARAIAPLGAAFAGLCLLTGSLWGRPTWGTWWEWDARLTSMLILFLTFLGYMALRSAIEEEGRAARFSAILALAGAINLPIVHYSVTWWNTLHQPASILRESGAAIDPSMLTPLLICGLGFGALFAALVLAGMRAEILERRLEARAARAAAALSPLELAPGPTK